MFRNVRANQQRRCRLYLGGTGEAGLTAALWPTGERFLSVLFFFVLMLVFFVFVLVCTFFYLVSCFVFFVFFYLKNQQLFFRFVPIAFAFFCVMPDLFDLMCFPLPPLCDLQVVGGSKEVRRTLWIHAPVGLGYLILFWWEASRAGH